MADNNWLQEEDLDTWNDGDKAETLEASHPFYEFYGGAVTIYFDPQEHEYYKKRADGTKEVVGGVTTILGVINKPFLVPWATKLTIETLLKYMFDSNGQLRKDLTTEQVLEWFAEAKNKHRERLNEAGSIGTMAHNALEEVIIHAIAHTGGVVKTPPVVKVPVDVNVTQEEYDKAQNCANAGYKWMVAHRVVWLHTERKIYSAEYNFSGTLDGDALVSSCDDRFCKGCRGRVFENRRAITDWKSSNQLSDSYAYQTAAYQFAHLEEFPDLYIPDRWIMRLGKEDGDFECWYLPSEYFERDFDAFIAAQGLYNALEEIESRRKAENKEFREYVSTTKRVEREAADEAAKEERRVAREELRDAKQDWDRRKKLCYQGIREDTNPATGKRYTKAEAEELTEKEFPKSDRPGAKDEEPEAPAVANNVGYCGELTGICEGKCDGSCIERTVAIPAELLKQEVAKAQTRFVETTQQAEVVNSEAHVVITKPQEPQMVVGLGRKPADAPEVKPDAAKGIAIANIIRDGAGLAPLKGTSITGRKFMPLGEGIPAKTSSSQPQQGSRPSLTMRKPQPTTQQPAAAPTGKSASGRKLIAL